LYANFLKNIFREIINRNQRATLIWFITVMESLRRALDATLQYTMSAYDDTQLEETNPNA